MLTTMINTAGNSNKFYTVVQSSNRVRVKWGRIDSKGSTALEVLDDRTEAIEFAETKIYSKLQNGYRVVDSRFYHGHHNKP